MHATRTFSLAAAVAASLLAAPHADAAWTRASTYTNTYSNTVTQMNSNTTGHVSVSTNTNTYTYNGTQTRTQTTTFNLPTRYVQPTEFASSEIQSYGESATPCNGNCAEPGALYATELSGFLEATALNDMGDVVGQINGTLTSNRRPHAGIWEDGTVSDLGMIGCRFSVSNCWSKALGMNNLGTVVGESHLASPFGSPYYSYWSVYYAHEAIFRNGQVAPLKSIGWEYGAAEDINNRGTVVGHSRSTDWVNANGDYLVHGYVLKDGAIHEIGSYGQTSRAVAVNDSDVATGEIAIEGYSRAYQWTDGVVTVLGHLGGLTSRGKDIANSGGAVVGESADAQGTTHATLWVGTEVIDLGMLPGSSTSSANAINEAHTIVGRSGKSAAMWQLGRIFDLNDYVVLADSVRLIEAIDINNHGEILAKGSDGKFYLISPVVGSGAALEFKANRQPN